MPDPVVPPTGDQPTTPTTPTAPAASTPIGALTDEQIELALKDERIYKSKRFADLRDAKAERDQMKADQKKAEDQKLADEKKWQELADSKGKEAEAARATLKTSVINSEVKIAAIKLGAVDPKVVLKLIDQSQFTVKEDGTVDGDVEAAVKKYLDENPYLKGKGATPTLGAPTSPTTGEPVTGKKFKASQLQDAKFYAANQKEIWQAMKLGQIEDDLAK